MSKKQQNRDLLTNQGYVFSHKCRAFDGTARLSGDEMWVNGDQVAFIRKFGAIDYKGL